MTLCADDGSGFEIEWTPGFTHNRRVDDRRAFASRNVREIGARQLESLERQDVLRGHTAVIDEDGAQRLVAADDFLERAAEHVEIERAFDVEDERTVVVRESRRQLIEKPQALLRE